MDMEKMTDLGEVAHTGREFVQERVVTSCLGVAKIAPSEDLNHSQQWLIQAWSEAETTSNHNEHTQVIRKESYCYYSITSLRATDTTREILFTCYPRKHTCIRRKNRNLTTIDLQSPDIFNPIPQVAHLTVASPVSEPEPSSWTEAHVTDVERPQLPSMWPSSEMTKRLVQDLDAQAMEILTSAGQTLALHIYFVFDTTLGRYR